MGLQKVTEFSFEDDRGVAFIEVDSTDEEEYGRVGKGAREVSTRSSRSFNSAIAMIRPITESFIQEFQQLSKTPDEILIEFGIKLSSTSGVVITSSESVSNFRITLKWKTTLQE